MEHYKIVMNRRSVMDLQEIYRYIADEKGSPGNAKKQTDRIREAIMELSAFPQSHQERMIGRYANKGYRQLIVDHYLVIYKTDEQKKTVRIITIQHQLRNL